MRRLRILPADKRPANMSSKRASPRRGQPVRTVSRRTVHVALCALVASQLALGVPGFGLPAALAAPRIQPRMPGSAAPAAGQVSTVLMEVTSGDVLQASGAHAPHPPASLDKLMTLYLTLQAMHQGRFKPDTNVTISAQAWRIGRTPGSSRMFLNVGDTVTVAQLLSGLMVASGNDAAEALAETVGGSAEEFVNEMNATAARLGMHDTHFVTPHGLPAPGEHVSAWDMAILARRLLLDFPEATQYSSPRYESYAGIKQANWNNLVFRDPRVDGLKTGHTSESGYSIVATAHDGNLRLVSVVLGAPTLRRRTALAEGMFAAGFNHYTMVAIPWQTIVPSSLRLYGGRLGTLPLVPARPVEVLVPRGSRPGFILTEHITVRPFAPLARGRQVGTLVLRRDGHVVETVPLLASVAVDRSGLFGRLWGAISYAAASLLRRYPTTSRGTFSPATT